MHRANSVRHMDDSSQPGGSAPASSKAQAGHKLKRREDCEPNSQDCQFRRQSGCEGKELLKGDGPEPGQHLKSCLSDGDFNEILIKVDHDETNEQLKSASQPTTIDNDDQDDRARRRRSNCSNQAEAPPAGDSSC